MIAAVVTGIVGTDAELKSLGSGDVLSFRMASDRWDGRAKAKVSDWVAVSMFGARGAKLAGMLQKGTRVAVRGSMWVREYSHQGVQRWSLELRADDVELTGGRPAGETRQETPARDALLGSRAALEEPGRGAAWERQYGDEEIPF